MAETKPANPPSKAEKKPMALPEVLTFQRISETSRPKVKGTIRLDSDGIRYESESRSRTITIPSDEIEEFQWSPLGRDCRLRVFMIGESQTSFRGFSAVDFTKISAYVKKKYEKKIETLQINTSGHNYGRVNFKGSVLRHFLDDRCTFEIPLTRVSQAEKTNKNELSLQFHEDDTLGDDEAVLTEMILYVPPKDEDEDGDALQELRDDVVDLAGIRVNSSESIAKLEGLMLTVPRGKYDIELYKSFFRLHGSSFNYKILYQNVKKLLLMQANDNINQLFVIGLDPPIRQGKTMYSYLIMQIRSSEERHMELKVEDEEIEKAKGVVAKSMTGKLYELTWRLFSFLTKRKVAVPGKFRNNRDTPCVSCSYKTHNGFLFFFKKSFFFIHKPPTYLRHDQIASVEFSRLSSSTGTGRIFDIEFNMRDEKVFKFRNINKENFQSVFNWIKQSNLRITNIKESSQAASNVDSRTLARETKYIDPYLNSIGDDDEDDDDDEDEDFKADSESSSDPDEYEEKSQGSSDEEEDRATRKEKAKMRQKAREAKKSKKKKKKSSTEVVSSSSKPAESSSTKKEKSPKAPKAPKRAQTAFHFFNREIRPQLVKENPEKKFIEIASLVGKKWKELSEEDKKPYEEKHKEDQQRYKMEKKKFNEDNPDITSSSKKRKKKNKNAPKKGKSAFLIYSMDIRSSVTKEFPDKKFGEIQAEVGKRWKALSKEEKLPYEEKSKEDKKRYLEEKQKYDEEHKDDPEEEEEEERPKKRQRKKKKLAGQPKRYLSAFFFYIGEKRESVKEMNPEMKNSEVTKKLGAQWRALSAEEKQPYQDKSNEDKVRYEREMIEFKKKLKAEEGKKRKEEDEEEEEEEKEEKDVESMEEDEEDDESSDDDEPIL
eukprot:CAMPEP_0167753054 /NCGR_PEP_ID=MMETSP0110_2-20121227/7494_1 /TAXON_ID=629695 /ORGANISM="Gymnochlora sp., Strain CCMP2014" /LENGTH=882 /DNA_ID=CAMNT_0007638765 /DNA_START=15 /DNA_END=2663 /DNA_ORIENTATION=-